MWGARQSWPVVVAAIALLGSSSAAAQSPYETNLSVDLPLIGLGTALAFTAFIEVSTPACSPHCDPSSVNAFDRSVLNYHSAFASRFADAAVYSLVLVPAVLEAVDAWDDDWGSDVLIYIQTLVLTQGFTQLTKAAVHRPAPYAYAAKAAQAQSREDQTREIARSFFSGHAATAFAATTAYTVTFWLRHPESPMRFVILIAGAVLSSATAVAKVAAGGHFWTDIAAGALVGTSMGVLVPVLHIAEF